MVRSILLNRAIAMERLDQCTHIELVTMVFALIENRPTDRGGRRSSAALANAILDALGWLAEQQPRKRVLTAVNRPLFGPVPHRGHRPPSPLQLALETARSALSRQVTVTSNRTILSFLLHASTVVPAAGGCLLELPVEAWTAETGGRITERSIHRRVPCPRYSTTRSSSTTSFGCIRGTVYAFFCIAPRYWMFRPNFVRSLTDCPSTSVANRMALLTVVDDPRYQRREWQPILRIHWGIPCPLTTPVWRVSTASGPSHRDAVSAGSPRWCWRTAWIGRSVFVRTPGSDASPVGAVLDELLLNGSNPQA